MTCFFMYLSETIFMPMNKNTRNDFLLRFYLSNLMYDAAVVTDADHDNDNELRYFFVTINTFVLCSGFHLL